MLLRRASTRSRPLFDRAFGSRRLGEWRLLPTRANRMPAAAGYLRAPGRHRVPRVQARRPAHRGRPDRRDHDVRRRPVRRVRPAGGAVTDRQARGTGGHADPRLHPDVHRRSRPTRRPRRYDDLRAVVFNGTLKRSPEPSQTDGLLAIARGIMERVGVQRRRGAHRRPRDPARRLARHDASTATTRDDFPQIYRELVVPADIIILAGPIWLGDQSSHDAQDHRAPVRLLGRRQRRAASGPTTARSAARVTTGNEDGGKHVSAQVLYALQHIGLTVPPQSDAYWVGEAGPGPVLPRRRRRRRGNAWTTRNTRLHDLEHAALRANAQGRRRHPRLRQLHARLGPRHSPTTRTPSTAADRERRRAPRGRRPRGARGARRAQRA